MINAIRRHEFQVGDHVKQIQSVRIPAYSGGLHSKRHTVLQNVMLLAACIVVVGISVRKEKHGGPHLLSCVQR